MASSLVIPMASLTVEMESSDSVCVATIGGGTGGGKVEAVGGGGE